MLTLFIVLAKQESGIGVNTPEKSAPSVTELKYRAHLSLMSLVKLIRTTKLI